MKHIKPITALLLSLLLLLLIPGCTAEQSKPDDGKLKVVASFAPVYALTLTLCDGAENISVSCMAANSTGCLHDYQITADDMRSVESADIYVIGGAGMEGSFLDKVTSTYPNLIIADSSKGVKLISESDGGEEAFNSHIWLSTENASVMAQNIAAAIIEKAPESEPVISANLEKFTSEMENIKAKYADRFAALEKKEIITFHEAFEYLADEFGIGVAAVIEAEPGTAPDPQTLNSLIDTVKSGSAAAVFTEPQYPDDTAQVISRETGVAIYSLDPIVTGEMNKNSFAEKLDDDLDILLKALS